ncbi:hypothetical protein [Maribacter sp. LLG6340-A2]
MKVSFFAFILFSIFGYSQNTLNAVVVDNADNSPLEFVVKVMT